MTAFKRSAAKTSPEFAFVPTNCHVQLFRVDVYQLLDSASSSSEQSDSPGSRRRSVSMSGGVPGVSMLERLSAVSHRYGVW